MTFTLNTLLLVAVGGAAGSVFRFMMSATVQRLTASDFPYGTLSVNLLGSFLIGFFYVVLIGRSSLEQEWRAFILIGLLGGFTTFSSFSMETLLLLQQMQWFKALANMLVSVSVCLLATWSGTLVGRVL